MFWSKSPNDHQESRSDAKAREFLINSDGAPNDTDAVWAKGEEP